MSMRFVFYFVSLFLLFGCEEEENINKKFSGEDILMDLDTIRDLNYEVTDYSIILRSGLLRRQYAYSSTIKFDDGSLLMAGVSYGGFYDLYKDTKIIGVRSFDNGKSWSEQEVLQTNIGAINVGSPSLVKVSDEHLLLFFNSKEATNHMDLYFKESFDRGKSWGNPKIINKPNTGYYVINNGRVVYENNRLWAPVAVPDGDIYKTYDSQKVFCFYSDDLGQTWNQTVPLSKKYALMEPCLTVLSQNELLLNIRTKKGKVLFARSYDNGVKWEFEYSNIKSPAAPQTIIRKRDTDTLFMAWNNTDADFSKSTNNRTPLTIAYSPDKGRKWNFIANVETASNFAFSYPSMLFDGDKLLLTYYELENAQNKVSIKQARINSRYK